MLLTIGDFDSNFGTSTQRRTTGGVLMSKMNLDRYIAVPPNRFADTAISTATVPKSDGAVSLITELADRLSALAEEFNERALFVTASIVAEPGDAFTDSQLREMAQSLLDQRRARRRFLPEELFHEPAWDMLLALFVARHDHPMNIKALVATSDAPVTTSQRWVEHLYKLRLVNRVSDPTDRRRVEISLNEAGQSAIVRYLTEIAGN